MSGIRRHERIRGVVISFDSSGTVQETIRSAESVEERLPRLVLGNRDLSLVHTADDEASVQEILLDGLPEDEASDIPLEAASATGLSSDRALKRYSRIGLGLAATDLICILAALFLAQVINSGLSSSLTAPLVTTLLWTPLFYCFGLYSIQHLPASEEFRRIIGACSFGILLVILLSYLSEAPLSGSFVSSSLGLALAFELVGRRVWRLAVGRMKDSGRLTLRTLVVGTNEEAHRLAEVLKRRGLGFAPIGYVGSPGAASPNRLPLVGHFDALADLIRKHEAECLFVASTAVESGDMLKVVQAARQTGTEVRVSANLPEILTTRLTVQTVSNDLMAITLRPARLTRVQELMKRSFDVIFASLGLILSSPVMMVAAISIGLTSRGPVLFRQQRVTKGGREFTVYKFRTMKQGGDSLLTENAADKTAAFFKVEADPRLTKVGGLLRKLSIDELPQLLNVVKGDMSLVGPRPLPVEQVNANPELLTARHEVFSGVTGWWQVNGRSDLSAEEAVRLDLFYIENWALSLDLFIILKTIGVLLRRRGAY
jgi:exopolysaccharide biosynthesis polyprenyl glycosylphosphotransferase